MSLTTDQIIQIVSPILTLIASAIITQYAERKSKLISYIGHISNFNITGQDKNPDTKVFTHSVIIRNAGKKTAKDIKIGHHYLPLHIDFLPQARHKIEREQNPPEIIIDSLVPKEQITISYLYVDPYRVDDIHSYIKSDDGFAKEIKVIPTIQYPKSFLNVLRVLMFAGASLFIYWLIKIILFVT